MYLKCSCQKALDILWAMGHTDLGANCIALPCLYHLLVCSKLDCGCVVFGSALQSVLRQMDLIHHQGLCITLGASHTAPAQSLYVEAHNPSLASCRLKPALNYVLKLKSQLENPAYSLVVFLNPKTLFEDSPSKILPLSIHMLPHPKNSKLNVKLIDDASFLDITPWMLLAHSQIWSE